MSTTATPPDTTGFAAVLTTPGRDGSRTPVEEERAAGALGELGPERGRRGERAVPAVAPREAHRDLGGDGGGVVHPVPGPQPPFAHGAIGPGHDGVAPRMLTRSRSRARRDGGEPADGHPPQCRNRQQRT